MSNRKLRTCLVALSATTLGVVSCSSQPTAAETGAGEVASKSAAVTTGQTTAGPLELMQALGITPSSVPDPDVIGGSVAATGKWPWQADVGIIGDPTQVTTTAVPHDCGGSLISERWVVTAGHCVFGNVANEFIVRLGEAQRSPAPDENIQIRGVKSIALHPNYTDFFHYAVGDDIALLELNEPVKFTARVRPVALARTDPPENGQAWVSGWGRTDGSISTQSDPLMEAQLQVRSQATCNATFATWGVSMNDAMLCAGTDNGAIASCNGDSGGPLVYRANANSLWEQYGIVSWGITGCISYSVFTRVSRDEAWVRSIVPKAYKNGDVNRDGCVTIADATLVSSNFNQPPTNNVLLDVNNDGVINTIDYTAVVSRIESNCTPIP